MEFKYTAYNSSGTVVKGEVSAKDAKGAAKLVKDQDLILVELTEKRSFSLNPLGFLSGKASAKEKVIFTKELAIMIKAGLPLVEALKSLAEGAQKKEFRRIILAIGEDIQGGTSLSASIQKYPNVFPPIYSSVVQSGEKSGKLDNVLFNLSEQMQKDAELVSKVKGALTYPALILFTLLVVGAVILIFVIPQLEKTFNDVGVPLPLVTKILLWSSHFMVNFWWLIIIVLVGFTIFFLNFIRTKIGIRLFDRIKFNIPLFKNLFVKIYTARFARTAYTLISSGVPINEIFKISGQVINNVWYADEMDKVCEEIKAGKPLSGAIDNTHKFPHLVSSLIKVGEQSGKIDYVLETIADYYEKEVDADANKLSTLIEPVVMIVLGFGVGFVVISVLMPIYKLVEEL